MDFHISEFKNWISKYGKIFIIKYDILKKNKGENTDG